MRPLARSLVVACALLTACGGRAPRILGPDGKAYPVGPPFLDRIPADTPYIIASLNPMPAAYVDRELARAGRYERALAEIERVRRQRPELFRDLSPQLRFLLEVITELRGKLSRERILELGVGLDARFAIYGIGVMPVARLELRDAARFRATLERVIDRSGLRPARRRLGDVSYWSLPLQAVEIAAAITGRELVVAVVTPATRDLVLPMAFGRIRPDQSLADTAELQRLAAAHRFAPYTVGYVDLVGLARAIVGDSSEVSNRVAKALGLDRGGPACATEIPSLADAVPRLAFGMYEIDERAASLGVVLEMRKDVARAFEAIAGSVPGLDGESTRGARFSLGLGLDVGGLLALLSERLGAIVQTPYRCSHLAGVNRLAQSLLPSLAELATTPFATLRGVNVIVHDIAVTGGLPSSIQALAFLATDDPSAVLAALAGQLGASVPAVAPGAPPVEVAGLGSGLLGGVFVAATATAIGVSVGIARGGPLANILAAPARRDEPPVLYSRFDPRFLAELQADSPSHDAIAVASPELAEILRSIDREQYDDTESMTFSAVITELGLIGRADVTYRTR
jgi:hypothetical protein